MHTEDGFILFTKVSALSNHYQINFEVNGKVNHYGEQFLMEQKNWLMILKLQRRSWLLWIPTARKAEETFDEKKWKIPYPILFRIRQLAKLPTNCWFSTRNCWNHCLDHAVSTSGILIVKTETSQKEPVF